MKKNIINGILVAAAAILLNTLPAGAVFDEKNLAQTLSVLRFELSQENRKAESISENMDVRNDGQHRKMVEMLKKCNELSLILYSQNRDFTFDMTYALKEVTRQYEDFNSIRMPFDEIVENLDLDIERYERLLESLRRLPPALDKMKEVPDSIAMSKDSMTLSIGGGVSVSYNEAFMLEGQSLEDRDSCVFYARNLLRIFTAERERILEDNEHYSEMSHRLKESYDYAQNRYRVIQKNIFVKGQDNYFKVLSHLGAYTRYAAEEVKGKYGNEGTRQEGLDEIRESSKSEWRGPIVIVFIFVVLIYIIVASILSNLTIILLRKKVAWFRTDVFRNRQRCFTLLCGVLIFALTIMLANRVVSQHFIILASSLLLVFAWLMTAILCSILIRVPAEKVDRTINIYLPTIFMGLTVIFFRIIFIPNKLLNLVYPPLLLIFTIWQLRLCRKGNGLIEKNDMTYSWISCLLFCACTLISWSGYVLMSVQIFIWWLFQFAAVESVNAIYHLLSKYEALKISKKREEYKLSHNVINAKAKGAFIEVTWFYDLVKDALLPMVAIITLPLCIRFAADVFDLTEICKTIFYHPFFNLSDKDGNAILHLSLFKMVIVGCLFFVFRYIAYVSKSFYRHYRYRQLMEQSGKGYIHTNEVNLTLANNLISIGVWGSFAIMTVIFLKIPMGALSVVAAGLATGIGLALKDVLNNFIYGIQLMSGRLRVGDYIDCDGIRGKVESISYQSTQIETLDGSIMAITNTALFNKNFKNLTKNNSYELVKIPVGVHYGADIETVRAVLLDALKELQVKDKYGRNIVEPKNGIVVAFDNFGDSSVDLTVKQFVLVDQEAVYIAKAKELIYNALNRNGIEIPFPQRDVYIRSVSENAKL